MSGKNNILITGGTGYIGSEIANALVANKDNNIAIVTRDINVAKNLFKDKVTYIKSDDKSLKNGIIDFFPNIVIHLAAYSSSSDTVIEMKKLIESNIVFTSILLDALSYHKLDLFINTGSFSEYYYNNNIINPTYFYSVTKTSAKYIIEYFSKKNNFKYINAILYTVYGKKSNNKKIIDYAMDSLNSNIAIKMSEGRQVLDFIHIDDVVNFYINLINNYKNLYITQKDYCVGTGRGTNIRELVQILEDYTNKKANIQWGANKNRSIDTKQAIANTVKTKEDINWSANIDIHLGIQKYTNKVLGVKCD